MPSQKSTWRDEQRDIEVRITICFKSSQTIVMYDPVLIFLSGLVDGRKGGGDEMRTERMSSGIALVASSMTQHAASKMDALYLLFSLC